MMRRMTQKWLRVASGLALLGTASVAMTPGTAEACGGTFCDGGVPGPMPVDQSGENVIFVIGDTLSEVHVQIQIDPNTNAEQFGWLVPLADVPEFSVGSQPLFDQIRAFSVPTYDITTTFEDCGGGQPSSGGDPTFPNSSGDGSLTAGGTGEDGGEGPTVLKEETVGAFDVVVLQDTEVGPIKQWLLDNGYVWDANAEPILMQYLAEGNVIAAFKLNTNANVADVHPITLRYPSNETCFPLRLTRIAAVEDMDIRVFVLSEDRAAPTNYRHVLVNPLKIDWLTRALNYKDVITQAVDAFKADGRAFVTEYAGPSAGIVTDLIYSPSWDDTSFVGLDPVEVVNTLNTQGLGFCYDSFGCSWGHPQIFPLLVEFLPAPANVEPAEFYADLGSYAAQIDAAKWANGDGFAAALLNRVIEPGMHADELLKTWPYLTRMYTTISPAEMMADPIFHLNPDLEEVANLRIAQNLLLCNGDGVVTLPDEREIYVPGGSSWPAIPGEEWYAEEVQTVAIKGAPMTIVNNTGAINKKLDEWNRSHDWPRSEDSTGTGSDTSGEQGGGGCGCRSDDPPGAWWLGLSALGLLARRRRAR